MQDSTTQTNPTFTHVPVPPQQTCPRCGYCPHCGRSNQPPTPWGTWPYQWWHYPYTVTWGVSNSALPQPSGYTINANTAAQ